VLLSTRRSLEAYLVDSGCARCNVLDRLDFAAGRGRSLMTRGLWLADFQQEFPISELRCSCSSGAGLTTLSIEVAVSVALHCRKLGRDRTNALIAVGRPLSPQAQSCIAPNYR
jgi:hypothetical protein